MFKRIPKHAPIITCVNQITGKYCCELCFNIFGVLQIVSDITTLVHEVEARRGLWDLSSAEYSNKPLKDVQWEQVGLACGCTGMYAAMRLLNRHFHILAAFEDDLIS